MRYAPLLIVFALFGCGESPPANDPVVPDAARAALRRALDSWKAGTKIEALASESPKLVAQDFDWMAGARLLDYAPEGEGTPEDANLRIRVKLSLRDAKGKAVAKTVTYVVGTAPVLTVMRALE